MNKHTAITSTIRTESTGAAELLPVPVALLLPALYPGGRRVRPSAERADVAGLTPETIARLITTYTNAGDLIVDLTGGPYVARATDWFGRRSTTVITDRSQNGRSHGLSERALLPSRRATTRTLAARPGDIPGLLVRADNRVRLIVAALPLPGTPPMPDGELRRWVEGFACALRPGGFAVVAVGAVSPDGSYTDRVSAVITAAKAAGLTYHQHLVTVDVQLPETPPPGDPGTPGDTPRLVGGRHRRVHSDLIVLTSAPGGGHV